MTRKRKSKRRMRPGGGKAKGANFERFVCKTLSLWVSNGKSIDCFWRSAMSGGRATVRNRKGKKIEVRQAGDICAVSPEGHVLTDEYYIECKHVRNLGFDNFMVKNTGPLAKFWSVAIREAKKHKKIPVIIARQNLWPDLVITTCGDFGTDPYWMAAREKGGVYVALLSDVVKAPLKLSACKGPVKRGL